MLRKATVDTASTGIPGLDEILLGGFPRNRIYLIQGDPGVGKTTLSLQYLLSGAAKGEKCLYISLSETTEEIRQVADSHGWSLDNIELFELSAVQQAVDFAASNTLFESSDVELQETTQILLTRIEQAKASRVVFDSLSELRLLAQGSLRYRRQILALKQYFAQHQATVLLIDDRTSDPGDMHLQSIAHGVLSLEQSSPQYGDDRRRLRIVKLRGRPVRSGYHDFTVVHGGLAVFPRLVAADHKIDYKLRTLAGGIPELDTLLGGGLDAGTSTLVLGPAGSGKSAIAAQYAVAAAARGEHAIIFAFEENFGTLFARCRALGIDLATHVEAGRIEVRKIVPAEMAPGEFAHVARMAVEEKHAKLVVIDSLNSYLSGMPAEQLLAMQMHELLAYFAARGVTTLMVLAQHGMLGRMESPVDVSYLADSVLLLRFFEARGRIRKAISVIKKRSGAHEDTIREFTMGPLGLKVGHALDEFTGILTGVPKFTGDVVRLIEAL